ncbi:major capsid protein [Marichromatium gracile]|nr:major capsid protein [Marichromatium gracile]MCF1183546.1 major capsid protein [Marichromatium gracile]
METLTSAVDFSSVSTAVLTVGAAVVAVVVVMRGVGMVISAIRRA